MFTADLQWKIFNVDLAAVSSKLSDLYGSDFVRIVAGIDRAQIVFNDLGSEQENSDRSQEVKEYWAGLSEGSPEAISYRSQAQVDSAMESVRVGILSKSWDSLSQIERKLILNISVSKQDLMDADLL